MYCNDRLYFILEYAKLSRPRGARPLHVATVTCTKTSRSFTVSQVGPDTLHKAICSIFNVRPENVHCVRVVLLAPDARRRDADADFKGTDDLAGMRAKVSA